MRTDQANMKRAVITGMGLVTPLGVGVEHNWRRLVAGDSGARAITEFETSDLRCKIACFVPRGSAAGEFDADRWVPASEQRKMDMFIVFGLAAAQQAVDDSRWLPQTDEQRNRTGVLMGSGIGGLATIEDGAITVKERGARRLSPFFIPAGGSRSVPISPCSGRYSRLHP